MNYDKFKGRGGQFKRDTLYNGRKCLPRFARHRPTTDQPTDCNRRKDARVFAVNFRTMCRNRRTDLALMKLAAVALATGFRVPCITL